MSFFPLKKPLTTYSLIKTTCHLYTASFFSVLPLSFLLIMGYHFIQFGTLYLPPHWQSAHLQIAMFVLILMFPLSGALLNAIDQIGMQGSLSYRSLFITTCQQFLSLIGCVISMIFFPAILFGMGLAIYLCIQKIFPDTRVLLLWQGFTFLMVFASFIRFLFAPLLVVINKQEINQALSESTRLVSRYFTRTFFLTLYAIVILICIAVLPLLAPCLPDLQGGKTLLLLESLSQTGLILLTPWSYALLITQKQDLEYRKKQKNKP